MDEEYHRALVRLVIKPGARYEVEFVTTPHDEGAEAATATVDMPYIHRPFFLQDRPIFANPADQIRFQQRTDVVEEGMKVLAVFKEQGETVCWLPAEVQSKDMDTGGQTNFTVQFMESGHTARVSRGEIDPLFNGMPLKYDGNGREVYPSNNALPDSAVAQASLPYMESLKDDTVYDEIPYPISNKRNFYGQNGYQSTVVKFRAGGNHDHRAKIKWQNITMMEQTVGEVGARSVTKVRVQHGDSLGTLEASWHLPHGVLAVFTDENGRAEQLLVAATRIVWWQVKSDVGVWLEIEPQGDAKMPSLVLRIRSDAKNIALNISKIMSARLMEGRTKASHYTK